MAEALEHTPPARPVVPLVANVSAAKATDPADIRDLLVQQVTAHGALARMRPGDDRASASTASSNLAPARC